MTEHTGSSGKNKWRKAWRFLWKSTLAFLVITNFWALCLAWINPPVTLLMIQQNIEQEEEQEREWANEDEIPFAIKLAAVSSEDQNFMKHNGIDFGAIQKAIDFNEKHKGKKVRGASTISQQVAKNVFLWPGRSWLRKGFEVYFTFLVELYWSKERILEVYLNVAETGVNTFGVQAAARKYFKKEAIKMSREECALIVAAIPSPRKSNPARPSAYLKKRQQHVLKQMRLLGDSYFLRYGGDIAPPGKKAKSKSPKPKEK